MKLCGSDCLTNQIGTHTPKELRVSARKKKKKTVVYFLPCNKGISGMWHVVFPAAASFSVRLAFVALVSSGD